MSEIQDPETRPAYAAAHNIADTTFAAAKVKALTGLAVETGFGPKDATLGPDEPIMKIAHLIGEIVEANPRAATDATNRPLTQE
ncbi:MAG TPA: hypothetical protein VFB59_01455 [Candidatus Saccharimonadales bacterium]|nr:hypothetical protein [Candidatus Saccharimonadales bacterium]